MPSTPQHRFTWDEYMEQVNACADVAKATLRRMERRRDGIEVTAPDALTQALDVLDAGHRDVVRIQRTEWWLNGFCEQRQRMDALGLKLRLP